MRLFFFSSAPQSKQSSYRKGKYTGVEFLPRGKKTTLATSLVWVYTRIDAVNIFLLYVSFMNTWEEPATRAST